MRLLGTITSSLVLTALTPVTFALPQLQQAGSPGTGVDQCPNPSYLPADISQGELPTDLNFKGACSWKLWAMCIGLAVGVCFESCVAGGVSRFVLAPFPNPQGF